MAFQTSADFFGKIRRLGFKCSWWHPRQANDAVASEPSIFSENHDYKRVFSCRGEHVCTYILGSRGAWWQKTTNRQTETDTETDTDKDTPRHSHRHRQTHTNTYTDTHRHTQRHPHPHTDTHTHTHNDLAYKSAAVYVEHAFARPMLASYYSLLRAKRAFWSVQCADFLYIYIYIYVYIFQAVRRAVNVLNVSTCI